MSHYPLKHWLGMGVVCVGTALLTTGCIDSDYDLNHVDLTMGLGSEGLSVKMGNTEKILLETIIDVDETVKLDKNNLYYMVEDGEAKFDVVISPIHAWFDKSVIKTTQRVLSFDEALAQSDLPAGATEIPVDMDFIPHGTAEGTANVNISIKEVSPDILSVSEFITQDTPVTLRMDVVSSPAVKFGIQKFRNLKITLPEFLRVKSYSQGWTLDGQVLKYEGDLPYTGEAICEAVFNRVVLGNHGVPVDGQLTLPAEIVEIAMSGEVFFCASEPFTMRADDYADVELVLQLKNGNTLMIEEATGRFDPAINPEVEPIDIAGSLPDFLKDDEVRITAVNPTIKFEADMSEVPAALDFSAHLVAQKSGTNAFTERVELPSVALNEYARSTVYYYQDKAPYDPDGVAENATMQQADNLGSLVRVLPDYVEVDLKNGKIKVQDKEFTAELDRGYKATTDYRVFIPFEFSKGLTIVYNDSTDSMGDDLADYEAEGVRVTAKVDNTIPLELVATAVALDSNGDELHGIKFSSALVAPSADGVSVNTTDLQIDADLEDPDLLKKIDRLCFRINAVGGETEKSHKLYATQYLQVKDIRIKLKGRIIADWN